MQLGSHVAVSVVEADNCSSNSNSNPSLGTSIFLLCKKQKKKKNLVLERGAKHARMCEHKKVINFIIRKTHKNQSVQPCLLKIRN